MINQTETLNDAEYDTHLAHVYTALRGTTGSVLIVITGSSVNPPVEKFEVEDAIEIPEAVWNHYPVASGISLFFNPPLTRGWVEVGKLSENILHQILLENNYIKSDASINDITDIRALTARPVVIRIVNPSENPPL